MPVLKALLPSLYRFTGLLGLVGVFSSAFAEQGDESAFFQLRAQHAYNAVYGLPAVAARPVQTFETQISVEHSNQFVGERGGSDTLILDGETTEITLRHRQRLGPCWQMEAHVPLVAHGGGEFDRAIDDWHRFFGFPDANREEVEFFQINYLHEDASGSSPSVTTAQSGIGDVQLAIQRSLRCFATADTTGDEPIVRLGIKLPSGNANELRGSGRSDVFADWQSPIWTYAGRWRFGANLGVLLIGQSDRFTSRKSVAVYGSAGVQFVLANRLRLMSQLDWHTPFYNSVLREIGSDAVSLSVGVRYLLPSNQTFEISISEDAAVDTAPDIVARLAWVYRPGQETVRE